MPGICDSGLGLKVTQLVAERSRGHKMTFLPNREVPILWDTRCINNQTPGRSNVTATRVCLATAAGTLLVSPANIQGTNTIVRSGKFPSVFYSCDHLGEFSHRLYMQCYTERHSKRYFVLQKSYSVDHGFVT